MANRSQRTCATRSCPASPGVRRAPVRKALEILENAFADVNLMSPEVVHATRVVILEEISYIRSGDGEAVAARRIETQRLAAEHLMAALADRRA